MYTSGEPLRYLNVAIKFYGQLVALKDENPIRFKSWKNRLMG